MMKKNKISGVANHMVKRIADEILKRVIHCRSLNKLSDHTAQFTYTYAGTKVACAKHVLK